MSRKLDSQKVLLEHSKAKVELLGTYLDMFLNIIGNDGFTRKIRVYDLFCGEGEYENKGEGSPITILRKVKNLHFINKARNNNIPPVDLLFNDIDEAKTQKLQSVIKAKSLYYPEYGDIKFTNLDYKDLVSKIAAEISKLKNEKAFIFIDPYGYKEVKASEIENLLSSRNSEVLLFLPTQFMYRFDNKGTPKALIDFLSEIVDYGSWNNSSSVWSFINQLNEGFRNFLGRKYFVDTFTIQKDPQTVFCLFFFSSHIRGFEKMLEAKWKLDSERGKGWSYEKTIGLFASQETNILEEKLEFFLKESKKYNGDIYEYTLRNGFLPKHATEIFKFWQKENKLFVGSDKNTKLRKGSFYINYQNYRDDFKRVFFKLQ